MDSDACKVITESGVTEFKWNKLGGTRYYLCAVKLVDLIMQNIFKLDLRVDTIVWDTYDSRHTIMGRDDMANYERMFFHLLKNSMKRRPRGCIWYIRPDVRGGIDWETIHKCLSHVGKRRQYEKTIYGNFLTEPYFKIKSFIEKHSHIETLIQVSDLFSGLSAFSRRDYDKYKIWKAQNSDQLSLDVLLGGKTEKLSNSEKYRSRLLDYFNNECKRRKLGVSLEKFRRLHTFGSSNPLNFWSYTPQGEYDKAPTKN